MNYADILIMAGILFFVFFSFRKKKNIGCCGRKDEKAEVKNRVIDDAYTIKKVKLSGMSCGHCVSKIHSTLSKINGIESVDVNLKENNAIIFLTKDVEHSRIEIAIEAAGYEVEEITNI